MGLQRFEVAVRIVVCPFWQRGACPACHSCVYQWSTESPERVLASLKLASAVCSAVQAQEQIRQDFSSGRLNLLLSTSVGAEGLDFRWEPTCGDDGGSNYCWVLGREYGNWESRGGLGGGCCNGERGQERGGGGGTEHRQTATPFEGSCLGFWDRLLRMGVSGRGWQGVAGSS